MPRIRIACVLPLLIPLPDGDYADGSLEPLVLSKSDPDPLDALTVLPGEIPPKPRSNIHSHLQTEVVKPEQVDQLKAAEARALQRRINRIIRWYRVVSGDAATAEVTLAGASPFSFFDVDTSQAWGTNLSFAARPVARAGTPPSATTIADQVRNGCRDGNEPVVEAIFLLDARQALFEGRFREAVLFSWSTIDATFSGRFEELVDDRLKNEWSESRKFLKGIDFGMRHRMTIGMRLVTGRSFFNEPDSFWNQLSSSYDRRNAIIHRGVLATEPDAENAVRVAENVVRLMSEIAEKAASE